MVPLCYAAPTSVKLKTNPTHHHPVHVVVDVKWVLAGSEPVLVKVLKVVVEDGVSLERGGLLTVPAERTPKAPAHVVHRPPRQLRLVEDVVFEGVVAMQRRRRVDVVVRGVAVDDDVAFLCCRRFADDFAGRLEVDKGRIVLHVGP